MIEWTDAFLKKWGHVFEAEQGCFPDWGFGTLWGVKFDDARMAIPSHIENGHWLLLLRYYDDNGLGMEDVAREIIAFAKEAGTALDVGEAMIKEVGPRTVKHLDGFTKTYSFPVYALNGATFNYNDIPEIVVRGDARIPRNWLACVMEWQEVSG